MFDYCVIFLWRDMEMSFQFATMLVKRLLHYFRFFLPSFDFFLFFIGV